MFIEPIIVPKARAFEPTTGSRMAGFFLFPVSLIVMAVWLVVGAAFMGGSVIVHMLRNAAKTGLAAVDYAGMVALGR